MTLVLLPERNFRQFQSKQKAIEKEISRLETTREGAEPLTNSCAGRN